MSQSRTGRLIQLLLLIGAAAFVAGFILIALLRISYPYQLEWEEGGVLQHVNRVLSGKPLYTVPSLEFVPFVYTPLYYYLAALIAWFIGAGLSQLRLLSFACSLGCFALIYRIARAETGQAAPAILAAGLFAATYRLGGAWLDIARVDALFLFLLLVTVYLLRFKRSAGGYLVAGALLALAFQTKQSALFAYPFFALMSLLAGWRRCALFVLSSLLLAGGSFLIFDHLHGGWYSFYTFGLVRSHPFQFDAFQGLFVRGFLIPFGAALVVAAAYFGSAFKGMDRDAAWTYLFMVAGMFSITLLSSLHSGGYKNVLIPGFAACSIVFGLASARALDERAGGTASSVDRIRRGGFLLLAVAQFGLLATTYSPGSDIPSDQDRRAGDALVKRLSRIDGEVLIPRHGYLGVMAGKKDHAHEMAMNDVLKGGDHEAKARLTSEIAEALREKRFGAIVVDYYWLKRDLGRSYRLEETIFPDAKRFWTVTGTRTRPRLLYVPKTNAAD